MSACTAWLLNLRGGMSAAVGEFELIHIIPFSPLLFEVPLSPRYCRNVVLWRDHLVPLMDLTARVTNRVIEQAVPIAGMKYLVGIVAHQDRAGGDVQYGALSMDKPPVHIQVDAGQACDLPASLQDWRRVTISCFEQPGYGSVPVLDLPALFTRPETGF